MLDARVDRLEAALARLADAQAQTQADLRTLTQRVDQLAEAQRRTEASLNALVEIVRGLVVDVTALKRDVGVLKGNALERTYRDRAYSYFQRILRHISVVSPADHAALADAAYEQGRVSADEASDLRDADLILRGVGPDGAERHVLVEVSAVIDLHDVERAVRRSRILGQAGMASLAVVAGECIRPDAEQQARAAGVWRVLDGLTLSPSDSTPADRFG